MMKKNHSFHMVEKSPWPLFSSLGTMFLTVGLVMWFKQQGVLLLLVSLVVVFATSAQWWRDVVREGSFQGLHSKCVYKGLKMGMVLFIVSEIMFFFSFFWSFFHVSLSPPMELGLVWPPFSVEVMDPLQVPLLNTLVLLSSGVTVTWAHHSVTGGNREEAQTSFLLTLVLAVYFSALQGMEYAQAKFCIWDNSYGSSFFLMTGFHGLHVIVGTIFIGVVSVRSYVGHFGSSRHMGLEGAIWYWHFVDVVWLFLFVSVYSWGSGLV